MNVMVMLLLLLCPGSPCGTARPERKSSSAVSHRRAQSTRAAEPRNPGPPAVRPHSAHDELRPSGGTHHIPALTITGTGENAYDP